MLTTQNYPRAAFDRRCDEKVLTLTLVEREEPTSDLV